MDRWFSLEQFQVTRHKPTNLKQGDRFFFFFPCAQRYASSGPCEFLSTSPSAARQVCRQWTGYNSSQQFLTCRKEKGREDFKVNMLGAPELKLQKWTKTNDWKKLEALGLCMSTLKAPGDISAPQYISEKAENNRPHSNVFQHLISGWSP